MKNKLGTAVLCLILSLMISGCGMHGGMNEAEVWEVPEDLTRAMSRILEEGETVEKEAYDVMFFPIPDVLLLAEAQYGLAHPLCFQLVDSENDTALGECVSVVKIVKDNKPYYMLYSKAGKYDFSRKAIIGSRLDNGVSQQYTLDGKVYDGYSEKFSWDKISAIEDYSSVEIVRNIEPGSGADAQVAEILVNLVESSKNAPDLETVKRLLCAIGDVTNRDALIMGAVDFHSLFLLVGVRIFAVVDILMSNPDPSQPYYGGSNSTRLDIAKMFAPVYKEMKAYRARVLVWNDLANDYRELLNTARKLCLDDPVCKAKMEE